MTVRHFLLTRFNLRMAGLDRDREGKPVLGPEWLSERLDLFERYCAPSVAGQTYRDFTWLLFLDEDTPAEARTRVSEAVSAAPDAELVFLPPIMNDEPVARAVTDRFDVDPDLLITSRVDNDDALHEDALSAVRAAARPSRREFLNLRFGYVTDGVTARVKSHKYGHYTSLVEPSSRDAFRTVHCGIPHGRARHFAPFRQLTDMPYWLEVIHGRNAANRVPGERRTYDFRSPRGLHRWLRFEVLAPARRRLWPPHYRVEHRLKDIEGPFNLRCP